MVRLGQWTSARAPDAGADHSRVQEVSARSACQGWNTRQAWRPPPTVRFLLQAAALQARVIWAGAP